MVDLTTPGRVLGGRYRLVEPLARGGMATVWVADDPVLSRRVAVKILRADLAADDATRARFRHEAIAAAKLSHPNIVSTYDTGDDDGIAYIVMELVEGPTLRYLIDQLGPLPVREVLTIGEQVAAALDAAHRAGLVHRDVKPANVLVPPDGPVKVTDFGIAKAAGTDDLTRTGTVMGTARYLAPEQVNGRSADARTDVYALGLVLYEALCGHPPFTGETDIATAMARLTRSVPAVRAERPEVPRALDDLIHKCLARRPAMRYASAAEVRVALDNARIDPTGAITRAGAPLAPANAPRGARPPVGAARARPLSSGPSTSPTPMPMVAASRRRRRRWTRVLWVLFVMLVAIGAGVAAFLLVHDENKSAGQGPSRSLPAASSAKDITASSFDPFADGQEDPAHVMNAVDHNPSTVWSTEQYRNFSEKPGVGLVLDLGGDYSIRRVTVDTLESGWNASIYVSDTQGAQLSDWGKPRTEKSDLGTVATFDLPGRTSGRYVLLWLTAIPSGPNGQQLQVSEVNLA